LIYFLQISYCWEGREKGGKKIQQSFFRGFLGENQLGTILIAGVILIAPTVVGRFSEKIE
jgi:hypothetical protein